MKRFVFPFIISLLIFAGCVFIPYATPTPAPDEFEGAFSFGIGPVTYPTPTPPVELPGIDFISYTVPYTPAVGHIEGFTYWDQDNHTLSLMTNISGTTLQVGQEVYRLVVNKTGAQLDNGTLVYPNGAQGNRLTVEKADADFITTTLSVGVITHDCDNNAECFMTMFGTVRDLNLSAYPVSTTLYLSQTPGEFTSTVPSAPAFVAELGEVVVSHAQQGEFEFIRPRAQAYGNPTGGNYTQFEGDGTLVFLGDARVWDDLRVPAQSTVINPVQSKPDFTAFIDGTLTFMFDPDAEESVHFSAQSPHGWDLTTDMEAHVHWSPTDTDTGDVVWGIECTDSGINGTLGATTIYTIADAADGTTNKHQLTEITNTFSISSPSISSMIVCRFFREGDHAADTYTNDAAFLEFDFHYIINTIGSREEFSK